MAKDKSKYVPVGLERDLYERLAAKKRISGRTLVYLVGEAVREYLRRVE